MFKILIWSKVILSMYFISSSLVNLFNVLFAIIILLTGERTSFFIFIISFLLINFIARESFTNKTITFLIMALTSIIIFTNIKDVKIRYIDNTYIQLTETNKNTSGYNFFSKGHENHYKIAYKMFSDSKFLGQGPNSFRILCNEEKFRLSVNGEGCSTHPHNIYMQLLGETGLIGFLFLLIAFFYTYSLFISGLLKIYKKNKNFENRIYFYVPIVVYLFPFIPTGNFFNSWVNIIVYLPMGFLLNEVYSKK